MQKFRVKRLPNPIAYIKGSKNGMISKSRILQNPFLLCRLPYDVDFQYNFRITSYRVFIPNIYKGYIAFYDMDENNGSPKNMFSEKIINEINRLKVNDVIIFKDINVEGPEGIRKIEDVSLMIKEEEYIKSL